MGRPKWRAMTRRRLGGAKLRREVPPWLLEIYPSWVLAAALKEGLSTPDSIMEYARKMLNQRGTR
jgi:hypothetical protein